MNPSQKTLDRVAELARCRWRPIGGSLNCWRPPWPTSALYGLLAAWHRARREVGHIDGGGKPLLGT